MSSKYSYGIRSETFAFFVLPDTYKVSRDPTRALSIELLTKATIQVFLAAVCWLLPLSAIAPPSALVVVPSREFSSEICPSVASLNFSRENNYPNLDGESENTISLWGNFEGTEAWVYSQPAYDIMRLAAMTLPSKNDPPSPHSPCPGADCSLHISFSGPAYRCEEQSDFDGTTPQRLDNLPPSGNSLYSCKFPTNESGADTLEFNSGVPSEWMAERQPAASLYKGKWGTFTKPYPLWIGYIHNTTKSSKSVNATLWPFELERKVLKCELNHATYTVDLAFEGAQQSVKQTHLDFRGPVLAEGEIMTPSNATYKQFA